MKWPTALLALSVFYGLVGCSGPSHWKETPGRIDAVNWSVVPEDHVRWLGYRSPNYDRAIRLLSASPVVELSPEQVREFWPEAETPAYSHSNSPATQPSDGTRAFLVRGVTYDPALRCKVWSSEANGPIWTHFQAWTDDDPVYAAFSMTHGSPVIVFLDAPPSRVYVSAVLQGDGVLKGSMSHP